ncbi:hypothetical protein LCGC14_0498570 [marine sediment metagenome]|uniref:Uncharacterized protein n=1 Tax=marine sediment metagenome TaxID=412755 RepID=A0A0F9VD73_9ZZZZ
MGDKERLDWLEKRDGEALISDDAGRWAISSGGMQNVPNADEAIAISTLFFVEAVDWQPSIREAIDVAIEKELVEAGTTQIV